MLQIVRIDAIEPASLPIEFSVCAKVHTCTYVIIMYATILYVHKNDLPHSPF